MFCEVVINGKKTRGIWVKYQRKKISIKNKSFQKNYQNIDK